MSLWSWSITLSNRQFIFFLACFISALLMAAQSREFRQLARSTRKNVRGLIFPRMMKTMFVEAKEEKG